MSNINIFRFNVPKGNSFPLYETEGEIYTSVEDAKERNPFKQFRYGVLPKLSQIDQWSSMNPDICDVFDDSPKPFNYLGFYRSKLNACNYVELSSVLGCDLGYFNLFYNLSDTMIVRMIREGRARHLLFWKLPFFREKFPFVVRVDYSSRPAMDDDFVERLADCSFGRWTSFTRDTFRSKNSDLVFAFTREADAVKFRLMVP